MFGFGSSNTSTNNQSEVASIMAQIDAESEAMFRVLNGFSQTASHEFISARYNRLGQLGDQLGQYIGEDEAIGVIAKSIDRQ